MVVERVSAGKLTGTEKKRRSIFGVEKKDIDKVLKVNKQGLIGSNQYCKLSVSVAYRPHLGIQTWDCHPKC